MNKISEDSPKWIRIKIGCWQFFSGLPVDLHDEIVVETYRGLMKGKVSEILDTVYDDPFNPDNHDHNATCHVVQNITKNIKIEREPVIMYGTKIIEVRHRASNRTNFIYTDTDLPVGTTVVYESPYASRNDSQPVPDGKLDMHVGVVVDNATSVAEAVGWVVQVVNLSQHEERKKRIKAAAALRKQLDKAKNDYQDMQILELIAGNNPQIRKMLNQYKELLGETPFMPDISLPVQHAEVQPTACNNEVSVREL